MHTLIFFAALAVWQACSQANQESKVMYMEDVAEERMVPVDQTLLLEDSLGAVQLEAMEELATQKVNDWAGYIQLAVDKKADPAFRKQAAELAHALMIDGGIMHADSKVLSTDSIVPALLADELTQEDWSLSKVQLDHSFERQDDGMYATEVSFLQGANAQPRKARVRLVKREKRFGNKTKALWEVRIERVE